MAQVCFSGHSRFLTSSLTSCTENLVYLSQDDRCAVNSEQQNKRFNDVEKAYETSLAALSQLRIKSLESLSVAMKHSAQLVAKLKPLDNMRCQDYAFLLNEYIHIIEVDGNNIVGNSRVHALFNGDTIVDMCLELGIEEKRFINTGWLKKKRINETESGVLGKGALGKVVRAVNMSGVFKDLHSTSIQESPQKIATKIKEAFRKNASFVSKHDIKPKYVLSIVLEHATSEAKQILIENNVEGVLLPVGGIGTESVYPLASENLKPNSVKTVKDFKDLTFALAKGLSEMHHWNIAHRDIKPGNILIVKKNDYTTSKLADLDLAVKLETAEEDKAMGFDYFSNGLGVKLYQSPSFITAGQKNEVRVEFLKSEDIYALGVTLLKSLDSPMIIEQLSDAQKTTLYNTIEDDREKRPTAAELASAFAE